LKNKCQKDKNKKSKVAKGSITVEASFIVGLALIIIFTVLALCFYMHNKAWYTAASGETAITASTYATRKDGDFQKIIEDKTSKFANGAKFPDISKGLTSKSNEKQIQITVEGKVPVVINNQSFQIEIDISSKVIKPVKFIRTMQSLQMIKEQANAS